MRKYFDFAGGFTLKSMALGFMWRKQPDFVEILILLPLFAFSWKIHGKL